MSGYTLSYEDDEALMYDGRYKESMTMYSFKNGALDFVGVTLPSSSVTQSEIESALRNSGYTYLWTDSDGDPLYKSADQKTVVYITYNSDDREYFLIYMPESQPATTVLYCEPYIVWGASKAQVKSYMSGYMLATESTDDLSYSGKYKESITTYVFENGRLESSMVGVSTSAATFSEVDSKIEADGYVYEKYDSDLEAFIYFSKDRSTLVVLQTDYDKGLRYVFYTSGSSYNSLPSLRSLLPSRQE